MNTSNQDYTNLYNLQFRFLKWIQKLDLPFYLTGGTALSRFYLNHRFSDDLDFFVNSDDRFKDFINVIIRNISHNFNVNISDALITDEFCRLFVRENKITLKIDFVNDVADRPGKPNSTEFGLIDTVENILANKISAIIGRDEPKDVFDLIFIADNYLFNWADIFLYAKQKSFLNEIDVEKRLHTFPVEFFTRIKTNNDLPALSELKSKLKRISDDFLLGKDNSICNTNTSIYNAKPHSIYML